MFNYKFKIVHLSLVGIFALMMTMTIIISNDTMQPAINKFPHGNYNNHWTRPGSSVLLEEEGKKAMCTITAKNYFARVRTLAESFKKHNPGIPIYVLLVDTPDDYFDPSKEEGVTIIPLQSLQIPEVENMLFLYDAKEACTAFKPAFMSYLFATFGMQKLAYLDPDIWIQDSFSELWSILSDQGIVVTPHIVEPMPVDGKRQDDITILRAGTMNLGFIAVNQGFPEALEFLNWWDQRLRAGGAIVKLEEGYHYDQKWVDLAPSFYNVYILRDQAYNVAYWNLHERGHLIEQKEDGYYYITQETRHTPIRRVVFFHFSGLETENIGSISVHQNRFQLSDFPNLEPIFRGYIDTYLRYMIPSDMLSWPYTYNYFSDGSAIHPLLRKMYYEIQKVEGPIADPFVTFPSYVARPVNDQTTVPFFLYEIWKLRVDLQRAFSQPLLDDQLVQWYKSECASKTKSCIFPIS